MIRMLTLIGALLVIGLGLTLSTPAAAQTELPGGNSTAAEQEIEERIDSNTLLLDSGFDDSTGLAWVEIRSETLQQITVTDGGGLLGGGEIEQTSITLEEGDETRISVPATEVNGIVAVSVATKETLWGVPIKDDQTTLSMPWESQWAALLVGTISPFPLLVTIRKIRNLLRDEGVVRVDG